MPVMCGGGGHETHNINMQIMRFGSDLLPFFLANVLFLREFCLLLE